MKRLSTALAAMLVMTAPVLAAPPDKAGPPSAERAAPAWPGPGAGPHRRDGRPFDGSRIGMRIAARLAAAETYIGIRSDQLDVWRAYTSALIDLFQPPARPLAPPPMPAGDAGDKAFAREERMAQRIKERAAKADTLLQAVAALREKLSPDQLDKLARIEIDPHPPMGRPGGRDGHGMKGPGQMGHGPKGPGQMGPGRMGQGQMGPGPSEQGPSAGEDEDDDMMMPAPEAPMPDEDGPPPAP